MEYLGGGHVVLRGFENEVFERSKNVRTEYLGVCETYLHRPVDQGWLPWAKDP